jgi:threonine/homoserine/homoserine lactone efflux protein
MAHYAVSSTFVLFVAASLVLAVTPGRAVIYLVTRTLSQGRAAGLASIGGGRSYGRYVTAGSFIALGIFVACCGSRRG